MLIIDRFEGDFAVCETEEGRMIQIERTNLPAECKEGSCMVKDENGKYRILEDETRLRKERMEERFKKLFQG